MRNLIRNKKAGESIVITLIVFLTIALVTFAIITFITKNKTVSGKVIQSMFLGKLYTEESRVRVYLYDTAKEVMSETYKEMGNKEEKDLDYDDRFKETFNEKLKSKVQGISFSENEKNLFKLRSAIEKDEFKDDFKNNILSFELNSLVIEIQNKENTIYASYKPEISFQISLDELK